MKFVHNISLRVFCNPEEDFEQIKKGFLTLLDYSEDDLKNEKLEIKVVKAKGFNDRTIKVVTIELIKDRQCNHFIGSLKKRLSIQDRELLLFQKDRLDSDFNYFIRLDKLSLIDNSFTVTDSGDCYHLKFSIASFPKNRDSAWKVVSEMLE